MRKSGKVKIFLAWTYFLSGFAPSWQLKGGLLMNKNLSFRISYSHGVLFRINHLLLSDIISHYSWAEFMISAQQRPNWQFISSSSLLIPTLSLIHSALSRFITFITSHDFLFQYWTTCSYQLFLCFAAFMQTNFCLSTISFKLFGTANNLFN